MPNLQVVTKHIKQKTSLNFNKKRRSVDYRRALTVIILVAEILGVILLAYVVVNGFFLRETVNGESMEPSLSGGNHVFLDRASYHIFSPNHNDVVAFSPTNNPNSGYSFKRVIGVPGDVVQIREGYLYLNGEVYEDVITMDLINDPGIAEEEIKLEDNEYFLLGDNRNNSEDSRFPSVGTIHKEEIVGRVWFCFSPEHFGPL